MLEWVRLTLDWLTNEYGKPILFAGFSFGSYVGLRASCGDPRVAGLIALGLPVSTSGRSYTYEFLSRCTQPKLFVSGDHDAFCPVEALKRTVVDSPEPHRCVIVPGADHFFQGIPADPAPKLGQMQSHLRAWLAESFGVLPVTS
jgi:alpha/beta superfamily hydrolase